MALYNICQKEPMKSAKFEAAKKHRCDPIKAKLCVWNKCYPGAGANRYYWKKRGIGWLSLALGDTVSAENGGELWQ
mgnify:CR=1 FL=1